MNSKSLMHVQKPWQVTGEKERLPNRVAFSGSACVLQHWSTPRAQLTQRQLDVLRLLGEGLPNKLICRRLNIAPGTAKVHISSILRELGVTSRLQAVVVATRLGLLSGEQPEQFESHQPHSAVVRPEMLTAA